MTTTRTRSPERTEFLGDIITTAVEGGTNYWAQVSQYQYESHGEIRVYTGERQGDEPRATLHELNDDETGYNDEPLDLTIDAVARGLGKITRGEVQINSELRKHIAEASRENDAGDIDAGDADVIAQVGLLGEIRYG
jgi:hypothetical protein